jgi:hypothetical protein
MLAGQVVVFQQDPVLQCLMPALDLALGPGVIRRFPDILPRPFQRQLSVSGVSGSSPLHEVYDEPKTSTAQSSKTVPQRLERSWGRELMIAPPDGMVGD